MRTILYTYVVKKYMATINIRIDKDEKKKAQEVLENMGLDLSTAVKMYLKQVVNTESLCFTATTDNGLTLQKELEILETEQRLLAGKGESATAEEFISLLKSKI